MKNLLLMRHGNALSVSAAKQRDHERPLSQRGQEESLAIAKYLAQMDTVPEVVLASSAARCVQTGATIKEYLQLPGEIHSRPELYNASPRVYLTAMQQLDDRWNTVLFIGHNPGIQDLAYAARSSGAALGIFSSGAIARFSLEVTSWNSTPPPKGNCLWFITPEGSGYLRRS